jgi:hypothetical protein
MGVFDDVPIVKVVVGGLPGASATNAAPSYVQTFTGVSVITINHQLGKFPSYRVVDTDTGQEVHGSVVGLSETINTFTIEFSRPFNGIIYVT